MHVARTYQSAIDYWDEVGPFLLEDEARHSLAIGIAKRYVAQEWRPDEDAAPGSLLASVWQADGSFDFAAWCTPPHALTVTGGGAEGIRALVELIRGRGESFDRCNGPTESIEHLARAVGRPFTRGIETALHRLDALEVVATLPKVEITRAVADEEMLVRRWAHQFAIDCGLAPKDSELPTEPMDLQRSQFFLARDGHGEPVSMTAITRETPSSANLSYVYTPEPHRGRGYASALVAAVSQRALDGGKSFCTLFTDLANPTSNKIYAALGYRRLSDSTEIRFEPE